MFESFRVGAQGIKVWEPLVHCLTTDWTTGVRSLTEANYFSSSLYVQTSSEAHPASYPMDTGGKAMPGHDADYSPPSSAEVKN
jgi:hypothetical protein